ncbi:MAG TPA: tetratricopeptide repeat protein [Burkholderiaceae bacterium]|nr:tetratricopeptide repeat protein [Burkholderiaceae bacterium]HRP29091.1 tetratricopeptide repeat protein [Burkholderiaceae bacterium]
MSNRFAIALVLGLAAFGTLAADSPEPAARPAKPAAADLTAARALIARQDWNAAIAELQRAARSEPKNADIHNLLGYSYRNAGQLDKAFGEYEIALGIDPRHKGAHEYVGIAYLAAKQPDKAKEHLAALKSICGENCEEYQDLAKAIADYKP